MNTAGMQDSNWKGEAGRWMIDGAWMGRRTCRQLRVTSADLFHRGTRFASEGVGFVVVVAAEIRSQPFVLK